MRSSVASEKLFLINTKTYDQIKTTKSSYLRVEVRIRLRKTNNHFENTVVMALRILYIEKWTYSSLETLLNNRNYKIFWFRSSFFLFQFLNFIALQLLLYLVNYCTSFNHTTRFLEGSVEFITLNISLFFMQGMKTNLY